MSTQKSKQYKHLGRRVENTACGILGRVARAEPRKEAKRGWEVWIAWDDQHTSAWTDRDVGHNAHNRLVPDDYAPNHGPIADRIRALIDVIDRDVIGYRYKHISSIYVGKDSVGLWRPFLEYSASAHLWAGQGNWEGKGKTREEAFAALRFELVQALGKLRTCGTCGVEHWRCARETRTQS